MRKILQGAKIGVLIGLVISIVNSYVFASGIYYPMSPYSSSGSYFYSHLSETTVFIIALIVWALIGIVSVIAGKIFLKEDWSIFKMTATHFVMLFILFLPLSILGGWYPLNLRAIASFIIIFIIVYVLLWTTLLTINIIRINRINKELNN